MILLSCGIWCHAASPDGNTVWRIGVFDEASIEFDKDIDYSDPTQDPVFIVGQSTSPRDWPAYQPGSANGPAGYRVHPFTIIFNLPERPVGQYTLKLGILAYTPRLPRLQIKINGHTGWFYQHPKLNYRMGDPAGNGPTYATDVISAQIPAAFFLNGRNRIQLAAIDEPAQRDDSIPPPGRLGDSGITYDALELDSTPQHETEAKLSATVVPTIFFKSKAGELSELVEIYLKAARFPKRATVALTCAAFTASKQVSFAQEFGEQKVEFEVPESTIHGAGKVVVTVDGKAQEFTSQINPAKKWTVFVVPHEHLDIGYSDYQAKTYEIQSRALDQAIEGIQRHPSFHYTIDGSFIEEQFLSTRTAPRRKEFLDLVRKGNIGVPANYFNLLTGFATSEEIIRSLYTSYKYFKEYGGAFDYASITDVPSYSWSYASILSSAGLKYLVAASNNERAPILRLGHLNARSPFLWEGPDGSRIPMWYSQSYQQLPHIFGLPPQVVAGRDTLPIFLQQYSNPDYHSDGVIIYGSQWENTALYAGQFILDQQWNSVYAFPRIRFSGFSEAMKYITTQVGNDMPVIRGDGGPYWEDGIASDALYAAIARQNQQRAVSAEMFSTIGPAVNSKIQPDSGVLDSLWRNLLLFDEHCWEADRSIVDPFSEESVRQRAVKESRATEAKRQIDELLGRGLSVIADFTANPSDTLMVFNGLNWQRSGLVETDLTNGLELVDLATGDKVPYDVLYPGNNFLHVRFWAENLPSVGYKSYALRPSNARDPQAPAKTHGAEHVLENDYYRIVLDPESGAVKNVFDKDLHRELVDQSSDFHFNQYVYVTGADQEPNRLTRYSEIFQPPAMQLHPAGQGHIVSITKTPFGTVAHLTSVGLNTPKIETEIILFDRKKEVQFTNRITKDKVFTKEGVYFAFPFQLENPEFLYETQNGYVNPARDMLPGAGLEWFSVQHWAAVRNSELTAAIIPVDAPLIALGDVVRGTFPALFGSRNATIFSYVMNNYWTTNYVAGQGGDFVFRYVLVSGRDFSPGALSKFGREAMTPFETDIVFPQDRVEQQKGILPSAEASFLQIDNPNLVMNTWKQAEDGNGMIMRLVETGGETGHARLGFPLMRLRAAWQCNALEECHDSLPISGESLTLNLKPFEIMTLRIQTDDVNRGH